MSLQSCREEASKVIDDYVKSFGVGKEIKSTADILGILTSKGLELDTMFQIPDMCYNKTNKANLKTYPDDVILFEYVTRGKYRILGSKAKYTGKVIWTDKSGNGQCVGEWNKGVLNYWGDKIEVN